MKIWTLVWFLVFPPGTDSNETTWQSVRETSLTQEECISLLAEKEFEFRLLQTDGGLLGYELYCMEAKGKGI